MKMNKKDLIKRVQLRMLQGQRARRQTMNEDFYIVDRVVEDSAPQKPKYRELKDWQLEDEYDYGK